METLYVYADFDWFGQPQLVGWLSYESLRGNDSYAFEFDAEWLSKHNALILSSDLNNYAGKQYTSVGRDIFGCFADALPDRWGRMLLNRREQLQALAEKRQVHRLSSFDYLKGIDDFSRMGAFRFKTHQEAAFINAQQQLRIPPFASLQKLSCASMEVERCEQDSMLPQQKWIAQLVQPGSSLGGARPKACVTKDNNLFIAKFPSLSDTYDVALWEHLLHLLAKNAGICAANTMVLKSGKYHTLLSQRFDRTDNGRRIHFASAMTMLGFADGDNAATGYGYLDIVGFIVSGCCNVAHNIEELYRRVAFNIAVGNTDDHFRNHGFLLTQKGWTLSPAYDMNPTVNKYQSLLINTNSNESDLALLLSSCEDYLLTPRRANEIISDVTKAVADWKSLALQIGIPHSEIENLGFIAAHK